MFVLEKVWKMDSCPSIVIIHRHTNNDNGDGKYSAMWLLYILTSLILKIIFVLSYEIGIL